VVKIWGLRLNNLFSVIIALEILVQNLDFPYVAIVLSGAFADVAGEEISDEIGTL